MKFSAGEAFKAALKIFSQNFFVVFSLSIFSVIVIPLFVFLIWSLAIDFTPLWDCFAFPSPETFTAAITTLGLSTLKQPWLYATVSLVSLLVSSVSSLFMISALLPAFTGHKIKFRDYFSDFKKVFNYFLGSVLILGAAIAMWCFVFGLVPFIAYGFSVFVSVLLLALVVASIVSLRYSIFFDIEILGGNQVLKSFKNSSKLVSGNFCKIILILLLVALITSILFGIVAFIVALIGTMLFKSHLITSLIAISVTLLAMLIMVPFLNLVRIHVYTQLSLSKSNSLGNDD